MKLKFFFIFLFFIFLFSYFSPAAEISNVVIVNFNDTINQAAVEYLKDGLQRAEAENSEAVILLLDTPGGGLQETFDIADLINHSEIPVIGYVYPPGSAAWSAGTFILMSTHIANMADNTIIGSCQPVEIGVEGTRLVNDSKTINALTKWIETRAEMYNRNKTVVKRFITENLNLNETQSFKFEAIEYISSNIEELLENVDGTTVKTSAGNKTLNTINAVQINHFPSISIQLMNFFSNPILVSLLFILGIFAVIFGISTPGFGAEVFGVIAILLSLIGSGFSISIISIIFIIIGALLLLIEILVTPGFGIIGIGGVISLIVGSIFLIPSYPNREWLITMDWIQDAIIIIVVVIALIAIFFVYLLYKILQSRKRKKAMGTFIGETARTIDKINPGKTGYVRFKGELWKAISDEIIEPNSKVIILERDEAILKVKAKKI